MQFIVKYFSEIAIKSRPVRRRFVGQLTENLRAVLRPFDPEVVVDRGWDKLRVETGQTDRDVLACMVEAMRNTPGITYVLEVSKHPLCKPGEIAGKVLPV